MVAEQLGGRMLTPGSGDLVEQRQISEDELKDLASRYGSSSFVASAKTGENVETIFKKLGEVVLHINAKADTEPEDEISVREIKTLTDVTDIIIRDFCESLGDQETAMATVRQQFSLAGVDVKNPQKEALLKAVERLADVEKGFKDDFTVKSTLAKRKRMIEEHG